MREGLWWAHQQGSAFVMDPCQFQDDRGIVHDCVDPGKLLQHLQAHAWARSKSLH